MKCSHCGTENEKGAIFCDNCGKKIEAPAELPGNICPHCGAENEEGAVFCDNCGQRIGRASAPSSAPKPAPVSEPSYSKPAPQPRQQPHTQPRQRASENGYLWRGDYRVINTENKLITAAAVAAYIFAVICFIMFLVSTIRMSMSGHFEYWFDDGYNWDSFMGPGTKSVYIIIAIRAFIMLGVGAIGGIFILKNKVPAHIMLIVGYGLSLIGDIYLLYHGEAAGNFIGIHYIGISGLTAVMIISISIIIELVMILIHSLLLIKLSRSTQVLRSRQ